jgi:phospholipase/carboxylesterase
VTLESLVRTPVSPSDRPPLLLLLHGLGADETDLFGLAPRFDSRFLVVSARAPYLARPMGFAWYAVDWATTPPRIDPTDVEASREALSDFIPELCEAHGADPARVWLYGFSQGATMSFSLSLARPDLVRGFVAHSGRVLPQSLSRAAAPTALTSLDALVQHGRADDVVPVERGREARDLLAPLLGPRLAYREYDLGHAISDESLADAADWLAARAFA